jgi:hypothetical protein
MAKAEVILFIAKHKDSERQKINRFVTCAQHIKPLNLHCSTS